jgi:phosphoglycolate phosphatase-like HAD superfamily hydrolase
LAHLFKKVIGDVHEKGEVIKSLVDDFNLDKDSTFYVGDTSGDVEAGKYSNVKTIGISWGFQHKDILSQ